MKLDIEGHELTGLPIWLNSGSLNNIEQIAMEVHLDPPEEDVTLEFLQTFKDLELLGNFRIFNWEANNCWKNTWGRNFEYYGLIEIVLKRIYPSNMCSK